MNVKMKRDCSALKYGWPSSCEPGSQVRRTRENWLATAVHGQRIASPRSFVHGHGIAASRLHAQERARSACVQGVSKVSVVCCGRRVHELGGGEVRAVVPVTPPPHSDNLNIEVTGGPRSACPFTPCAWGEGRDLGRAGGGNCEARERAWGAMVAGRAQALVLLGDWVVHVLSCEWQGHCGRIPGCVLFFLLQCGVRRQR